MLDIYIFFCFRISDKIENQKDKLETTRLYRQLQLINTFGNNVQKNILGSLILTAIVATSAGLGLLVQLNGRMGNETNAMILVAMGMAFADGLANNMILLEGMVSMCANSKNVLKRAKYLTVDFVSRRENLLIKKIWISCDKIKVKFGDSNFLEELTPLRCLDFSVDMAVQLLLLSGSK